MRILCLWLPNWPIQRLLRVRPELKNRPLALVVNGPRGGIVAIRSRAAAAQGVSLGQPVAEAQALVRDLAVAPHQPALDRRTLTKLAEACERFSPRVALEEGDEPESLLLDITNLTHLWRSEDQLVAQATALITKRGYRPQPAVANTVGQAWALAHFGIGEPASAGGEQGAGSRERKLKAPHPALPTPHSAFHLPIQFLRLAPDTIRLLCQLGIETVAQLLALPRESLAQRFGDELLRRLDQFTGAIPEVIIPHRGLAALEVSCSLDEPTADRAAILHILTQLIDELAKHLQARDQGAVLLLCLLGHIGREATPLRVGLVEPSANPRQLMELIGLYLETVTLPDEVIRVEVRVVTVGRLGERQGQLFTDRWPTDPHQLAVLVNRLASRLGHEQVTRAELRASPVPERSVRWVPLTERSRVKSQRSRARPPALGARPSTLGSARPLLLYPQPRPIEVVCVAPDGPPQAVWLGRRRKRVVHHAGPERIETLWWRGPSVRRDYYRVATDTGDQLWLFRRLADANWFLHGIFA